METQLQHAEAQFHVRVASELWHIWLYHVVSLVVFPVTLEARQLYAQSFPSNLSPGSCGGTNAAGDASRGCAHLQHGQTFPTNGQPKPLRPCPETHGGYPLSTQKKQLLDGKHLISWYFSSIWKGFWGSPSLDRAAGPGCQAVAEEQTQLRFQAEAPRSFTWSRHKMYQQTGLKASNFHLDPPQKCINMYPRRGLKEEFLN